MRVCVRKIEGAVCVCRCVGVCVCVWVHPSKAALSCADQAVHTATVQASLLAFSHLMCHLSIHPITPSLHPSIPCGAQCIPGFPAPQCRLKHHSQVFLKAVVPFPRAHTDRRRGQGKGGRRGFRGSVSRMNVDPVSGYMNVRVHRQDNPTI